MQLAMKPLTERSKEYSKVSFCLNGNGIVTLQGDRRQKTIYAIDATDLSIVKHIPSDVDITGEDIVVLAYVSYLYCLRIADTRMMRRLTKVPREVVTATRDSVFLSFDLVKYKIATLRCVIQRLTPANAKLVERHFVECGLKREDAILYHLLYHNNDIQEFVKLIHAIEDEKFSLDVNVLSLELELNRKVKPEFEKAATYNTYKKLLFIINGNNFGFEDVRNDLVTRAIQAYYWVRPFYSVPHAINYAKSSIGGYTQCLIEYYTKSDRARVIRDENGNFTNVIREITDDVFKAVDIYETENNLIDYIDAKREYR